MLLFDYRGYGGNPGSPSEEGLALDVRAARDFLLEDADVPPERLLYFGESLGAAVVTELATEHPPAGLVLRSPFVDLAAVAAVHYPFLPARALLRDRFPVAEQLARVEVPTTVVYGSEDSIVPPGQSRAVAEAAGRLHRPGRGAGADHNDRVLLDGEPLVDAVVELAQRTALGHATDSAPSRSGAPVRGNPQVATHDSVRSRATVLHTTELRGNPPAGWAANDVCDSTARGGTT